MTILWVPCHLHVPRNNRADLAAKLATANHKQNIKIQNFEILIQNCKSPWIKSLYKTPTAK